MSDELALTRASPSAPATAEVRDRLHPWLVEIDDAIAHLGASITQSLPSDDQIIMAHVRSAYEIMKIVRRRV